MIKWVIYLSGWDSIVNAVYQGTHHSKDGNAERKATTPSTFVDVMKTARGWTSIWDRDTQPGQFSYQGGSLMWTSRQYEWGNGLQINQSSEGYVTSLQEEQFV